MFQRILILCVGNLCRSPMAAAMLRAALGAQPPPRQVQSAGLATVDGLPADPMAQRLLATRGLDLSGHRSAALTAEMVRTADLVLVMEEAQRRFLRGLDPTAAGKVYLLGHWTGTEVPDPYRQPEPVYQEVIGLIEAAVGHWLSRL